MLWIIFVGFLLFTGVKGIYESIGDITNNLASDLAPLITLFGEQATKQFLSESTSWMDCVIFSIAPLGVITAVVSVIRIYGKSSFKSLIGRSQEAHGVAEAELCSSTSQDVCELWSNGGICRVFGRPKILDFTIDTTVESDRFYPKYREEDGQDIVADAPSCGLQRPRELFDPKNQEQKQGNVSERFKIPYWLSILIGSKSMDDKGDESFANPNLALNIGIRNTPKALHWIILIIGILLQAAFFGYATWATFYNPTFLSEEPLSPTTKTWFGFTISGSTMLVSGMFLCARLIDLKSCEQIGRRDLNGGTSKIFWLQPGGQRIGDQLFHAFAFSEKKDTYITSHRVDENEQDFMLFLAVTLTVSGWILQFIGLRGLHGSIALFQLVSTLLMSLIRALLRGNRLEARDNLLYGSKDKKTGTSVEDHELDWQAISIDKTNQNFDDHGWTPSDYVSAKKGDHGKSNAQESRDESVLVEINDADSLRAFYVNGNSPGARAANQASAWLSSEEGTSESPGLPSPKRIPNAAAKIMRYRSRLAALTSIQPGLPPEQAWGSDIRATALQLQEALQVSAEHIFSQFPLISKFNHSTAPKALAWQFSCHSTRISEWTSPDKIPQGCKMQEEEEYSTVGFQMYNRGGKWTISIHDLEAVLGLWSWSLKRSGILKGSADEEKLTRSKMVVVENSKSHETKSALYLWVTQTRQVWEKKGLSALLRPDNLSVPTSILVASAESLSHPKPCQNAPDDEDASITAGFTILSIPTNGSTSLLQLMAQDVYTLFINRVVDIVGNLHGTEDPEDYLTMRDHSLSTASNATPVLEFANPHIEALVTALVSAGVATRAEALMSTVPAFLRQRKLPFLDENLIESLFDWVKTLRRESRYRQAAIIIIWMLSRCPVEFYGRALRCLGDLYRRAAHSKRSNDRKFGLRGMEDMKKRYSKLASSPQIDDILSCYERVFKVLRHGKMPMSTSMALFRFEDFVRREAYDSYVGLKRNEELDTTATGKALGFALDWSGSLDWSHVDQAIFPHTLTFWNGPLGRTCRSLSRIFGFYHHFQHVAVETRRY